ncbi:thiamine phosphate synthase [Burkholderia glumae]|uniref:thiamine phosphate synthase n=1 Tax=Burkholderia glumae TaxID=337 RepID=UPI000F5F8792|nr:thiamine phosphate synthase [Burkholderia glumae]MCQ0032282.1 thiamine phosphate synthase [Burkholderia glumae]MCQ0037076.1 thiamine phosphate synthase [Burkholderia glumae]QJW81850.1 thiamine phosphate synthase [Burkholderia glumae]RQZ72481.1 thiamine phosphate synthase [Burkholderia glumae]UVS87411.1 thiamine phosphate synthase [Burkholderia glumae]
MCGSEPVPTPALPPLYLITPEPASNARADLDAFVSRLDAAFATGIELVQLRVKTFDAADYAALAERVIGRAHAAGARVVCNGPVTLQAARALGADGIHFGHAALAAAASRPEAAGLLLSAACHDAASLRHADRIGADLATLSPVKPTLSHPGAPGLGWPRFAEWVAGTRLAVYALGGMTRDDLPIARAHGAHGVAGIRGLVAG